jgi:hypothetical protein
VRLLRFVAAYPVVQGDNLKIDRSLLGRPSSIAFLRVEFLLPNVRARMCGTESFLSSGVYGLARLGSARA